MNIDVKKLTNLEYIVLSYEKKLLKMFFGGNGDLYWLYNNQNNLDSSFVISKENFDIYNSFDILYNTVINANILKNDNLKESDYYKLLVKDNVISWHSDDNIYEKSDIVDIIKEEDKYILNFKNIMNKEYKKYCSVRFTTSGSRYSYFFIPFVHHYRTLINYEKNDQIHIEEYLYSLKKEK